MLHGGPGFAPACPGDSDLPSRSGVGRVLTGATRFSLKGPM